RSAEQKIPGRYIFTETLSHSDMLATLKYVDVFVLYSSYEGLSHLLVEALMVGTPAIAARVGGNSEVLEEQNLVMRGNTAELANRIKNIVDNAQKAKMPEFEKVTDKQFLPGTMLSETVKLLKSL
ncbi:MAG: glycosyltransferase, partial [Patescibacteria group bacterium]|nr:glycosyltransferase [Patescibacteria group bacterium]